MDTGSRCGAWAVGAVRKVLLAVVLVAAAGCSDGDAMPNLLGGGGGLVQTPAALPPDEPSADQTPTSPRAACIASVQKCGGPEYDFARVGGRAMARTPPQGFKVRLADGAMHVEPDLEASEWSLELRWTGIGRGHDIKPVDAPVGGPAVEGNRATNRRSDGSEEWYLNGSRGIEQGFVLAERPAGKGELLLAIDVAGSLEPAMASAGREVVFRAADGDVVLYYSHLAVFDADGHALTARLDVASGDILLRVDDGDARYPLKIDPLLWALTQVLDDIDDAGRAIAISGDTAIVGIPAASFSDWIDCGFVRFYRRTGDGAPWWQQGWFEGAEYDFAGGWVAVSGDTALVGAPNAEQESGHGIAYALVRNGSTWSAQDLLVAANGANGDQFGHVSVSGDAAVIGAPGDSPRGSSSGSSYLFIRGGTTWTQQQYVYPSDGGSNHLFGWAVAFDASTALAGAPGDGAGSVYAYTLGGTTLSQQQKLLPADGVAGDGFGSAVALEGDVAVVGAPGHDHVDTDAGAAYVFVRSAGVWSQQEELIPSDGAAGDEFGRAVAVATNLVAVGAAGATYTFTFDAGTWNEQQKLADGGSAFGTAVALTAAADSLLVGDPTDGRVYAYHFGKSNGESCSTASECASGHCADGVCCDTACGNGDANDCVACTAVAGGATDGTCSPLDDGSGCDDGLWCTQTDSCAAGLCTGPSPCPGPDGDADCNESCDEATDSCTAPDAGLCDDGLFCTATDYCVSGTCTGVGDPCPGPDGDGDCTESCDEATDSCAANDPNGAACNDGVFCNGTESCTAGTCGDSTGDPCADRVGDADTDCSESCNEASDSCTLADPNGSSCDDGSFCNGTETCTAGACTNSTGDPCPGPDGDGDCNESCDDSADSCSAPDDDGSSCDDGSFCNGTESCATGACTNSTGDPCTGVDDGDDDCSESCDEGSDSCTASDPDGDACDDGVYCNGTETCTAGACTNSTGDPCPGADGDENCSESCDEQNESCGAPDPSGSVCADDGLFCTGPNVCQGGSCLGSGDPCPGPDGDGNCTESCDEATDSCTANDLDGEPCQGGACQSGACLLVNGSDCVDGNECRSGNCVDEVCCGDPDCSPYRCGSSGVCTNGCDSTADCQPGYACSSDGKCVDASAQDTGADDGGCSCRLGASRQGYSGWAAFGLLGLGLVLVRRRRCSGQNTAA